MVDGQRVVSFEVNGELVAVPDDGSSLLGVLRDQLGMTSPKAGCSPQGQCGCCTVLVDGEPRISCVTPAKRVRGRSVTTLEGLDSECATEWGEAFCSAGGSQCGYCTPGIIMRFEGLKQKGTDSGDTDAVKQALSAHLCRCTGWQTIVEAWEQFGNTPTLGRDLDAASRRAEIEGGGPQRVSTQVALGRGGFSADTAPNDSLVAVCDVDGNWVLADSLREARKAAGKIQGRRTTIDHGWPLEVPPGDWDLTMRTTWVEPAILETDASWCEPGGAPSSVVANGGDFGSKMNSPVAEAAQKLANEHGRPVLAVATREDTVLWGPKRPPVAAGINEDGSGIIRVVACEGIEEAINKAAPGLVVELVEIDQPVVSAQIRGAGWVEAAVLLAAVTQRNATQSDVEQSGLEQPDVEQGTERHTPTSGLVRSADGASAQAWLVDGRIKLQVSCGQPLDTVVLRSYCIGAAHMAWSWLTSEALTVDADGEPQDLTIRSFGILKAVDMPEVQVEIDLTDDREPMNGSDAVLAAVAVLGWKVSGFRQDWPVGVLKTDEHKT